MPPLTTFSIALVLPGVEAAVISFMTRNPYRIFLPRVWRPVLLSYGTSRLYETPNSVLAPQDPALTLLPFVKRWKEGFLEASEYPQTSFFRPVQ